MIKERIKEYFRSKGIASRKEFNNHLPKVIGFKIPFFEFNSRIASRMTRRLIERDPEVKKYADSFSENELTNHYGDLKTEEEYLRMVNRYFLAKRVVLLKKRIRDISKIAWIIDVGDTDGIILNAIGKSKKLIGLNISREAVQNISNNGIMALRGDIEYLPLKKHSFEYVFCFETLEHLQNPIQALNQLAYICKEKCFITIPWVPKTHIHRALYNPDWPQSQHHIFEFDEKDFEIALSHTPFCISDKCIISVFDTPRNLHEMIWWVKYIKNHIFGCCFKKFVFYELSTKR